MLQAQIPLILSYHLSLLAITLSKSSRKHSVSTEMMNINFCWSANTGVSMNNSPSNIAYEFILSSSAVLSMFCSSYLGGMWDGR